MDCDIFDNPWSLLLLVDDNNDLPKLLVRGLLLLSWFDGIAEDEDDMIDEVSLIIFGSMFFVLYKILFIKRPVCFISKFYWFIYIYIIMKF